MSKNVRRKSAETTTSSFRPRFDPQLNWGHIMTAMTFIVVGLGAFFAVRGDIGTLNIRVGQIERSILSMSEAVKALTDRVHIDVRQDERLTNMDRRIELQERRIERELERRTPNSNWGQPKPPLLPPY